MIWFRHFFFYQFSQEPSPFLLWVLEKIFSLSALLLSPSLLRPSLFLVKQSQSTSLCYQESLFRAIGSFLSDRDNLFLECFSLFWLCSFSLSSDRILLFLRFLLGSAPFTWLEAFFIGDFFFRQIKVLLEEELPIASWPAGGRNTWSTWIQRSFWRPVWKQRNTMRIWIY